MIEQIYQIKVWYAIFIVIVKDNFLFHSLELGGRQSMMYNVLALGEGGDFHHKC